MKALKGLKDALFPENFTCELCGREIFDGGRLCKKCVCEVGFNDKETCPVCGRKTSSPSLCLECKALAPKYEKAASAIVYEGGGARLLQKFKDGAAYLKDYFADLLISKCEDFKDADGICFVPMTKRDKLRRGYNQAELLAKALSSRLGIPVIKDAIKKVKGSKAQKNLTVEERKRNLLGCFKADKGAVKGKIILLVDDVMTTGTTAEIICTELLKRGAVKIYFATAASVEYKVKTAENAL